MTDNQFEDLVHSFCNGTLSTNEMTLLEEELKKNTLRRDTFNSVLNLDAALKEEAERFEFEDPGQSPTGKSSTKSLWIAAVLLVSFNIYILSHLIKPTENPATKEEPTQTSLALISKTLNTESTTSSKPFTPGQQLEPGLLSLDKGIMQLELFSGVTLLIHGPAKLDIINPMHINLLIGKLRCQIPSQAKGFTINTNELNIVDLGTEFTIATTANKSDLFVNDGSVFIQDPENMKKLRTLSKDQGVSWQNKSFLPYQIGENEITFQQLAELDEMQHASKFLNWQKFAKTIRTRSDVILFYSFENQQAQTRTVLNESSINSKDLDGAIVGAKWVEGRWPQKKALHFSSTGDRIKLNIPGEYQAMTFSCWIKIQSFDRWLSSLILTDGFDANELHWQLSDSGEIILGVRQTGNIFSKPVISSQDLGRWLHIATVYDPDKKEITHYLDGREVHKGKVSKTHPIKLGKADIGNWTSNQRNDHSLRSLKSTLGEFIIFSSALGGKEIREIYEKGLPE
ncbi:MAG: hypothetical protein MK132_09860 [Lentisphaerales bacterium]|nr:hypothetical protein [Lentisphaerales bacterium]